MWRLTYYKGTARLVANCPLSFSSRHRFAMTASSIELRRSQPTSADIGGLTGSEEEAIGRHQFSLPRVDGGKDAWLFLAACFTVEALTWGKPFPSLHLLSIVDN